MITFIKNRILSISFICLYFSFLFFLECITCKYFWLRLTILFLCVFCFGFLFYFSQLKILNTKSFVNWLFKLMIAPHWLRWIQYHIFLCVRCFISISFLMFISIAIRLCWPSKFVQCKYVLSVHEFNNSFGFFSLLFLFDLCTTHSAIFSFIAYIANLPHRCMMINLVKIFFCVIYCSWEPWVTKKRAI